MSHAQNDPDRARGLISDAQGEFVQQQPGGPFDPRAFRSGATAGPATEATEAAEAGEATEAHPAGAPPMAGDRMTPPGREIDKARPAGAR
ncbi:hypothetical protein [Actinoplanes siamensis]|nr:hypothetical protein [Actinoplanes siamensis]